MGFRATAWIKQDGNYIEYYYHSLRSSGYLLDYIRDNFLGMDSVEVGRYLVESLMTGEVEREVSKEELANILRRFPNNTAYDDRDLLVIFNGEDILVGIPYLLKSRFKIVLFMKNPNGHDIASAVFHVDAMKHMVNVFGETFVERNPALAMVLYGYNDGKGRMPCLRWGDEKICHPFYRDPSRYL